MGDENEGRPKGRAKSKTRGSTRNTDRLNAFAGRDGVGTADWGACDPARIQTVVVAITAMGGAITFGLSRDLGAHSLTLLLDGNRKTLWFNGNADLDEELDGVAEVLQIMRDEE
jgi:hypothetical protein